ARVRGLEQGDATSPKLDPLALGLGDTFTLATAAGDLDLIGTPAGTSGYGDLDASAETFVIGRLRIRVASIDDLIKMKRAAGRTKDLLEVEHLLALRERVQDMRVSGLDPQQGKP
ncbi:MAG TPA: hypothetical protein VKK30_04865, partial [Actinomycetota bacterium]|nr:hypothetical protein [Actinomycetota bacterium]